MKKKILLSIVLLTIFLNLSVVHGDVWCTIGSTPDSTGTTCIACSTAFPNCKTCSNYMSLCSKCNPGYYLSSNSCQLCPLGLYCEDGLRKESCPAGTYSTATGATSSSTCTTCPSGSYCEGGSSIESCPAGTYSEQGASKCETCEFEFVLVDSIK